MNKRIGVVALAVLMLLSVTACGGAKYSKGTLSDNGFESEWMGIRFNAPEGYVVATQEELDNFISMGQDYVKAVYEENGKKVIDYAELTTVYELMTYLPDPENLGTGDPNLSLAAEKTTFSTDKYIEVLQSQIKTLFPDVPITWDEPDNVKVGGLECDKYTATMDYGVAKMNQSYYITKKDNRVIYFIVSYTPGHEEDVDTLMNAFEPY
ncbi:MAG: hypothetical protein K2L82_10155 [Lachnospiraceae bacterium]|nr:hypothetical protein [Lachnospiraceae bacterium]